MTDMPDIRFILGQVFSLLAALCFAYSTFGKTKSRIVLWQTVYAVVYSVASAFLGGYSAIAANLLSGVRNILELKGKLTKWALGIICALIIALGILTNSNGWIGILPITASVIYSILIYATKSVRGMHIAVMINMVQWAVFDFVIRAYPSLVLDIVIIVLTAVNYIRERIRDRKAETEDR